MKITPSKAIRIECAVCRRDRRPCTSMDCTLNSAGKPLQWIKEHCHECATDHQPEYCAGELVGVQRQILAAVMGVSLEDAICPLHPYRMGKNPKMSAASSRRALPPALQSAQFKKKETFSEGPRGRGRVGAGEGQFRAAGC